MIRTPKDGERVGQFDVFCSICKTGGGHTSKDHPGEKTATMEESAMSRKNFREETLDLYWPNFLDYLRDEKDTTMLQNLLVHKNLEDIFWLWYVDNELGGVKST